MQGPGTTKMKRARGLLHFCRWRAVSVRLRPALASTPASSVTLQKSGVSRDEAGLQDASLLNVQRTVSERLSKLIYSSRIADDGRLEVFGPNTVVRTFEGAHPCGLPSPSATTS